MEWRVVFVAPVDLNRTKAVCTMAVSAIAAGHVSPFDGA